MLIKEQSYILPYPCILMFSLHDLIDIILPLPSHWVMWLIFFSIVVTVFLIYAYPYLKQPRKEFRRHHIGIPIANVISLYIFTKMLEGVLYEGTILKVDAWFSDAVLALSSPLIIKIASFITAFGSTLVITILFILALAVLLFRKRWRYAILSTIAILGAEVLQFVIKALVHRSRPENMIATGFSFPSGHAISAIVFVSLLIYSFKDDIKNKIVKYVLIIVFSSFFVAVAVSRIILHVHWFSDVIAGMSLGLFWFMCVVLVERSITGAIKAVRIETKEAEPIVPKGITDTAKSIVPVVSKK